ncbi:hypothetical protein KFL_000770110 [Klebsormidium nitens]|uniref:Ubiquitin-like domain-containing protein n=1 Tax=Klebsormidium nitens TaxID=105231 RepID=A0A1Y1HZN6_KLENI|nr:hypothetical protein KFL_000770110 [Klebsormidium nitens]|eukprot:GAQ81318.1 hypothetical protein KFL_000770110 [Klebsormidium nitens]
MSDGKDPAASSDLVELLVRNPSASFSKDLKLKISPTATIQALKDRLKEEYDGHPPPAQQKLIISGQIVKDNQLLKDVLKHANLAEPQVVHLVIAGPKPDGSSSSTPPEPATAAPTQTPPAPRFAFRPPTTHGPTAPLSQPQAPVENLAPGPSTRSTPPLRPPPPTPENPPSSSTRGGTSEAAARTAADHSANPSLTSGAAQSPANAEVPQQEEESFAVRMSRIGLPPRNTPTPHAQQGGQHQQASTSAPQNPTPQNATAPSAFAQGAGPSGTAQGNGVAPGPSNAAAGLSQEALQQLYLQLLQSNPFLTPLACNLAALSMGLPPPQPNPGASPPLAALFPGFNFAAAPAGGQDQAAPEPQRAAPVQGGPFVGFFQAPAAAGGQAGGFAENRAFAFPVGNQGGPLQGAQIHFMPPGALPPQGFPVDPAAQAGLRQRVGQNGAPQPMQFGGIPQGVPIVVRVRRIQIDFMLIAKLAVIVFVLNQDGSIERLVLLTGLAVLAYLYQTGVLTPYVRMATERFQRLIQQQGRQQAAAGANQGAPANPGNAPHMAGGGALAGAVQRQRAGGGFLREIQLFVMGFITSLLPGFQAPEGIPEPGQVPPPAGVAAEDRPHRD